jgi:hypothetical protein
MVSIWWYYVVWWKGKTVKVMTDEQEALFSLLLGIDLRTKKLQATTYLTLIFLQCRNKLIEEVINPTQVQKKVFYKFLSDSIPSLLFIICS